MAIICAAHSFCEVESKRFKHPNMGLPPKVNPHPWLECWFVYGLRLEQVCHNSLVFEAVYMMTPLANINHTARSMWVIGVRK